MEEVRVQDPYSDIGLHSNSVGNRIATNVTTRIMRKMDAARSKKRIPADRRE
jgi:hypothetical protein